MSMDGTYDQGLARQLSRSLEQQSALNRILRAIQTAQTPAQVLEVAIDNVIEISWLGVRTSAAAFLMRGQRLRQIVNRNLPVALMVFCQKGT